MSEKTIRRWMRKPSFARAYQIARRQVLGQAVARLLSLTGKATETLERNLNCDAAGSEIRAAVAILNHAVKTAESLDFEQRIREIENHLFPRERLNAIVPSKN